MESVRTPECEPRIRLFFNLTMKNQKLLDNFVSIFSDVSNPAIRELILERFLQSLRKNPNVSDFLLENLRENSSFSLECARIFGKLRNIDPRIKDIFVQKAVIECDIGFVLPMLAHIEIQDLP
jgi:hypothetical protein